MQDDPHRNGTKPHSHDAVGRLMNRNRMPRVTFLRWQTTGGHLACQSDHGDRFCPRQAVTSCIRASA
jgi:hypothetical protein